MSTLHSPTTGPDDLFEDNEHVFSLADAHGVQAANTSRLSRLADYVRTAIHQRHATPITPEMDRDIGDRLHAAMRDVPFRGLTTQVEILGEIMNTYPELSGDTPSARNGRLQIMEKHSGIAFV